MVRVGIIGCGFIARKHVKTIASLDHFTLVSVSDMYEDKMKEVVQFYEKETGEAASIAMVRHYETMLRDEIIDVIIIAVSSGLHAQIAKQVIRSGKHVIIEKPIALSLQDAKEIISLAREMNTLVLVCHQLRYLPLMQKVKQLIEEGYFGELYAATATLRLNRQADYYTSADWKGTWESDGGMLINQGIHYVDLLVWLMGDVRSVYGDIQTKEPYKETEDIALGILTFENKAKGLIEANIITKPETIGYHLSVFGQKGSICIGGKGFNEIDHCFVEGYPTLEAELREIQVDHDERVPMYENFYYALTGEEELLMCAEESIAALEAIFALYTSDQKGERIDLPLDGFTTAQMARGNKLDES